MSLFKEHKEHNDYPCHRRIKGTAKRDCNQILRSKEKSKVEEELHHMEPNEEEIHDELTSVLYDLRTWDTER